MRTKERARTIWEVAVLAFLREDRMHPYQMRRLLQDRHKDELLALKPGSLYHAINRLTRAGFIEAVSTKREGGRPERTTYRLTSRGADELVRTVRHMVAMPRREPSDFFAGLSYLVYLDPADATEQLEGRAHRLETEIDALVAARNRLVPRVTRINLLEEQYLLTMRRAELRFVRGLLDDLRSRQFTWNLNEILEAGRAARRHPSRRKEKRP